MSDARTNARELLSGCTTGACQQAGHPQLEARAPRAQLQQALDCVTGKVKSEPSLR
jgi:hypothetical protein